MQRRSCNRFDEEKTLENEEIQQADTQGKAKNGRGLRLVEGRSSNGRVMGEGMTLGGIYPLSNYQQTHQERREPSGPFDWGLPRRVCAVAAHDTGSEPWNPPTRLQGSLPSSGSRGLRGGEGQLVDMERTIYDRSTQKAYFKHISCNRFFCS